MIFRPFDSIEVSSVSHNPDIKKNVFVKKGELLNVTQFARTVFGPGQVANAHSHKDMYELFYVERGQAFVVVNGKSFEMKAKDCIVVEPNDVHEVSNKSREEMVLLVLGITKVI